MLYRKNKRPCASEICQFVVFNALNMIILDCVMGVGHQGRDTILQILQTKCFGEDVIAGVEMYLKQ